MIRTGVMGVMAVIVTVAGLALAAPAARGQSPQIDNEDSRYTFHRADDGYLRLDGRTGQVSLCLRRPVGWLCQTVADERAALEAEIARVQADNVALKKELLTRNIALPSGIKPDPAPVKNEDPRIQLPSDAEINKMVAFVEKVWKRLVEMIVNAQKDILKKS
jgi:hypothetical protein